MTKNVELPYEVKDVVWVMKGSKPTEARVDGIERRYYNRGDGFRFYHRLDITYADEYRLMPEQVPVRWVDEENVAPTKESLMHKVFDL